MDQPAHHFAPYASTLVAVLLLGALGGCSLWPKSLSLSSEPLPRAEATAAPAAAEDTAPASMPASVQTQPVPAATATPVAQPAPVKPVEAADPVSPPATTTATTPAVQPSAPVPVPVPVAAAPAPDKVSPSGPLAHGFYVNVGIFAVAQNANTVRSKLDDAGLPIVADTVKAKEAPATRIRVGPFAKRAQAQAAAKKIHALKLDAVVVRH